MRWADRSPHAGGPFNETAKPSLIAGGYSLNNRGDTPWEAKRKQPPLISTQRRLFRARRFTLAGLFHVRVREGPDILANI
jgi:hypothetical protein